MTMRKISEEHKLAISKANKGRVVSNESRIKMSNARKGIAMNTETKLKISNSLKGKPRPVFPDNKGRKRSIETKNKISEIVKSKWASGEIKGQWNKGRINPNAKKRIYGYRSFLQKRRELRKKTNGGTHTFEQWNELKLEYGLICPCCGKKEPSIILTEDHIKPISKGGSDNIDNIQPLCLKCNMKKGIKEIKYFNQVNNSITL